MTRPRFITSHPDIVVCSAARATTLCADETTRRSMSGLLSIADPDDGSRPSSRIRPQFATLLDFDDVEREVSPFGGDVYVAPDANVIEHILFFGNETHPSNKRAVIHCFAGRSRSTAAAFIILCDRLGVGREREAMAELLKACERTPLPNTLMCSIADDLMGRGGALHIVAKAQNAEPEDCEADGGKPVTGTALLAAIRRGDL